MVTDGLKIAGFLGEAFGGTIVHADTAVYAGEGIITPLIGLLIDRDASGRAFGRTTAAENTPIDVIDQFSAHLFKGPPLLGGIRPGRFFFDEVSQDGGSHFKHGSMSRNPVLPKDI